MIGKLMKQNEKAGLKGFNIDFEDHFPGYEGELNEAKDNAILICHALSGNHLVAGLSEDDKKRLVG
mgnify:CR=1 FL=1